MSYQALYRKYRPDTFDDVRGQDHIVTTLRNQISTGRFSHAYLFCGTRGTGKTTVAKIFARAVNCADPRDGSPCGECPACKAIKNGISINMIEMDAASNRGIDDIRQLIEEVSYPPVEGRFKVYIVDEVHMLTEAASNALLKTLEEPPEYVIFILATTDPQKLLTTILSRCQRYDFRRIGIDTITARLREVLDEEGLKAEERALSFIAKCADGSMRDALSLLDQCVAFHFGKELTFDMAIEVLGAVDTDIYARLLSLIMEKNIVGVMGVLEEIVVLGRDLDYFVDDLTWYMRNLLLVKSGDNVDELIDVSSENLKKLKEQAALIPRDTLIRFIQIFCALSNRIRYEAGKRVLIEIELMRLCTPKMDTDTDALNQRMDEIEAGIRNASYLLSDPDRKTLESDRDKDTEGLADAILSVAAPHGPEMPPAVSEDLQLIRKDWNMIKKGFTGHIASAMSDSVPKTIDGTKLSVILKSVTAEAFLRDSDLVAAVKKAICDHVKKQVDIAFIMENEQSPELRNSEDLRNMDFPDFGMPVETEE